MSELIITASLVLFVFISYLKLMEGTIFGISLKKGHYPGFFFFYSFIVYIAPAVLLLNLYPIENFWVAFQVKQDVVFATTLIIILSFLLMYLILFFMFILMPKYFRYDNPVLNVEDIKIYKNFVFFTVLISIFFIVFVWGVFGVGHSFSLSFTVGESISEGRMALKGNVITKFLSYYLIIISPLLVALLASPVYKNSLKTRLFLFIAIVFMASWGGSKAPLLVLFIVYALTWATFAKYTFNIKSAVIGAALISLLLLLVYQVVLLQYPHLEEVGLFLDYFYQRVFVAQMIGIYEQFSLNINNSLYFWHGVPFASFFIDYPVFHKDLMMISENRVDSASIGIKNTYFVAEAYAMGGWAFILPSIFIYAVNFALSYLAILLVLNKLLVNNNGFNKVIVSLFLFSYLGVTGGFSDLMLFKVLFMMIGLMSPALLIAYFSRYKFVLRKK